MPKIYMLKNETIANGASCFRPYIKHVKSFMTETRLQTNGHNDLDL